MKYIIGLIYLPILALAGVIAIARLIFALIFEFAWDKGTEWFLIILKSFGDKLKKLKQNGKI